MQLQRPALVVIADPMPDVTRWVIPALSGGVDLIILRCSPTPSPDHLRVYRLLDRICGTTVTLALNAHPSVIRQAQPSVVHLPEQGISVELARTLVRNRRIAVGRSVHSVEGAKLAQQEGADYIVVGTIFSSPSHPDLAPAGLGFLTRVCEAVTLPVIAIGGITPQNASACLAAGATGIAVRSGIIHAPDARLAIQEYRVALDGGTACLNLPSTANRSRSTLP